MTKQDSQNSTLLGIDLNMLLHLHQSMLKKKCQQLLPLILSLIKAHSLMKRIISGYTPGSPYIAEHDRWITCMVSIQICDSVEILSSTEYIKPTIHRISISRLYEEVS